MDKLPIFTGAPTIFLPGLGYIVAKGPEFTKLSADPPRTRIGTVVAVWPTDKAGILDKARIQDVDVQVWVFSGDKYKSLQQINTEFPFGQHDITVMCTDPQYQKLTFTPCRESLFRSLQTNPKAKSIIDKLLAEAQQVAANIQNEIGRELTVQQIRDKLAGGGDNPMAAAEVVVTGEVDGIVDSILDG